MRNTFFVVMLVAAAIPVAAVTYSVLDHEPSRPRVSSSSHPRAVAEVASRRAPTSTVRAVAPRIEAPAINDEDEARGATQRVAASITAAEARGEWTPRDTAMISRDLGRMTAEDVRTQMARVGDAIEQRRMVPVMGAARSSR